VWRRARLAMPTVGYAAACATPDRKSAMRRTTIPIALVLLAATLVLSTPTHSYASSKPKVTVKLSTSSPGIAKAIQIKVCWSDAARGDTVNLDEESTASLSWVVVSKEEVSTSSGCKVWSRSSGKIGEYPYRAAVRQGHSTLDTSAIETDRTFGTISAMAFFSSEFGCQGGGTVTAGTEAYQYFCELSAGPQATSDYNSFLHPTTCRSLSLRMIATDNPKGSPSDTSNLVVEVVQGGSTQPAIFGANDIENFTYHLSGAVSALNVWATPGNVPGEAVYFLAPGSTAVCSSASGI
jgi:hypothetical protein